MSAIHSSRSGYITKQATLPTVSRSRTAALGASILLRGEGTDGSTVIDDTSGNNVAITRVGNTQISTARAPTGMSSSIFFDGVDDRLTFTGPNLSSTDFTVECWVNFNSFSPQTAPRIWQAGADASNRFGVSRNTSGKFEFFIVTGNTSNLFPTTFDVNLNQWYHLAFVRSGNSRLFFVDGILIGSSTATITNGTSWCLGCQHFDLSATTNFHNGYISNFRVIAGLALYTSRFIPPTLPLAITATPRASVFIRGTGANGSTTFTDTAGGNTVTGVGNAQITTAQAPTGETSSIVLDGSGDYLTVPLNSSTITVGSGDFTLQLYYRRNSAGNSDHGIYSTRPGSNLNGWSFGSRQGRLFLLVSTTGTSWQLDTFTSGQGPTLNPNQWYHIALTRQGSTWRVFVDGVLAYTSTMSGTVTETGSTAYIGADGDLSGWPQMNGNISNFQFIRGTALYTSGFTPPPLPLSIDISSTVTITNNVYGMRQLI